MGYGLKISKQGYSVTDPSATPSGQPSPNKKMPHLMYAVAVTYLEGAKIQLDRYAKAAAAQVKESPITTYHALHEASNLFEDLATVAIYTKECDHNHQLSDTLIDVRNHIRHDVRENFDNEDDGRKRARATRLGLDAGLQTSIGLAEDSIKVGGTTITLKEIADYLAWAAKNIEDVMNDARKKGYIGSLK